MDEIYKKLAKEFEWGVKAALFLLVLFFLLYILGIGSSVLPPEKAHEIWSLSAASVNTDPNISFASRLASTFYCMDTLALIAVLLLSIVVIKAYIVLLPKFFSAKLYRFLILALLQLAVLLLVASGAISGGH
ncbi:MAG: hypothetical protein JNL74_04115 [Fibrobacteres bacterium]|nr:hypothetical protein [Fibrobacterota bacterium]